jgi:hypothetical protein
MIRRFCTASMISLFAASGWVHAEPVVPDVEHVVVYHEPGRFGGWPANNGIWIWGDEILVGFSIGYYKDLGDRHHIDRERPERSHLARSLDGGHTWTLEYPPANGYLVPEGVWLHGTPDPDLPVPDLKDCPGGIDFAHPDFAMTVRMESHHAGVSRFWYSYDRGHTWEGPFRLPDYGRPGTAARTDYLIDGPHEAMLFLTAAKPDGLEGQPFCVRTTDGGATWEFVSWIGPIPNGFAIMPSTVRLGESEILTTVRRREGDKRWIMAYRSLDNGASWEPQPDPIESAGVGNPPSLVQLRDGRLCLIYAYRAKPSSIRAVLSNDNGHSWSEPIVLREDGTDHDIGYCRTVQRPDGKLVTVYYINEPTMGPERYIAATIWDVEAIPLETDNHE